MKDGIANVSVRTLSLALVATVSIPALARAQAARIYWLGQSLGGAYGIDLFAVEPAIRAAVFNVSFGVFAENPRLPPGSRPLAGAMPATRMPSLLNPTRRPALGTPWGIQWASCTTLRIWLLALPAL